MVGEEKKSVSIVTPSKTVTWQCVESIEESKRLSYGRFLMSPLKKGQADTIGIGLRRALLGEVEGTGITSVKFENIPHEYSTLAGIEESVQEILLNLKAIVLRSFFNGTCEATICARGPGNITAKDIILPPEVKIEIVDKTQYIANLTEPIELRIKLEIERGPGYVLKSSNYNFEDGSYPIDAIFTPVLTVNHGIYASGTGFETEEILFIEIWTNGSLTPREALQAAAGKLLDLFIPFLINTKKNVEVLDTFEESEFMIPRNPMTFPIVNPLLTLFKDVGYLKKSELKRCYIDELDLPPRVYNILKKAKINTFFELLHNKTAEDLLQLEHFRVEDLKAIIECLEGFFGVELPKTVLDF
uniref:DNA-directed RNA polymerase subunit alpha n=1 Tax=Monopsis stellarioides subsp. schimperiana TaxID=2041139 RepID=A0A291F1N1_9ASTR|nr:RNA polymerase alpha subunit [Monopsis stellarioides subsp. schimperiana]